MKKRQRWACTECGDTLEPPYNARWLCVECAGRSGPNPWNNISTAIAANPAPQEPLTLNKLDRMARDAEAARLRDELEQAERMEALRRLYEEQYKKRGKD